MAMKFAYDQPSKLSELVVIDIAPIDYSTAFMTDFNRYIDTMLGRKKLFFENLN